MCSVRMNLKKNCLGRLQDFLLGVQATHWGPQTLNDPFWSTTFPLGQACGSLAKGLILEGKNC